MFSSFLLKFSLTHISMNFRLKYSAEVFRVPENIFFFNCGSVDSSSYVMVALGSSGIPYGKASLELCSSSLTLRPGILPRKRTLKHCVSTLCYGLPYIGSIITSILSAHPAFPFTTRLPLLHLMIVFRAI